MGGGGYSGRGQGDLDGPLPYPASVLALLGGGKSDPDCPGGHATSWVHCFPSISIRLLPPGAWYTESSPSRGTLDGGCWDGRGGTSALQLLPVMDDNPVKF